MPWPLKDNGQGTCPAEGLAWGAEAGFQGPWPRAGQVMRKCTGQEWVAEEAGGFHAGPLGATALPPRWEPGTLTVQSCMEATTRAGV